MPVRSGKKGLRRGDGNGVTGTLLKEQALLGSLLGSKANSSREWAESRWRLPLRQAKKILLFIVNKRVCSRI